MGWMMAQPAGRASDWTEAERQELLDMAPEILACRDKLIATLANIQKAVDERKVEIGGYQTAYQPMMYYLRNYDFWFFIAGNEIPAIWAGAGTVYGGHLTESHEEPDGK